MRPDADALRTRAKHAGTEIDAAAEAVDAAERSDPTGAQARRARVALEAARARQALLLTAARLARLRERAR